MISAIEWDTATVLTVILAPLCILFVGIIFWQWGRINELKNDKDAAVTKATEADKRTASITHQLADTTTQKDGEINRQKKEIENLHNDLRLATPKDIEPETIPEPPWNRPKPFIPP